MHSKSFFTGLIILFLLASQVQANFAVDMIKSNTDMMKDHSNSMMDHCMSMSNMDSQIDCHSQMQSQSDECEDNCDSDHCVSSIGITSRYMNNFEISLTQELMNPDSTNLLSRLENLQRPPKLV